MNTFHPANKCPSEQNEEPAFLSAGEWHSPVYPARKVSRHPTTSIHRNTAALKNEITAPNFRSQVARNRATTSDSPAATGTIICADPSACSGVTALPFISTRQP